MADAQINDSIPETYMINVVHEQSREELEHDKKHCAELIHDYRQDVKKYNDLIKRIDKEIIRPLWRQWNKIFVNQFANVNYGNAYTVHKSQGSSFYTTFIDADDIMNNDTNVDEMKRCVYTAFTRASNEIHILV